jgi:site-specific recombinase XerD
MNPDDPEPPQPPEQPRKRKRGGNRKTGIERAETLRRRVEKGTNRHRSVGHKPLPEDADPAHLIHHARPYLHHLASRNYSPATIERREQAFKRFFGWTLERGIARADEITMPVLEAYQAWLWRYRKPDGKTMGVNTQRGELLIVQAYFRWLVRQRVILSNPASDIELPRQESRLPPDALTLRQVDALLSIPDTSDPLGIRDRAILETLYSTAIRRAELTKLRLEDLNPERATLRVFGKGNKERVVPVGQKALHWLDRYLEEVRPRLLIRADCSRPLPNGIRRRLPRPGSRPARQRPVAPRRHPQRRCPHPTAHLRHPFARRRSRPTLHPAAPRSRQRRYHRPLRPGQHHPTPAGPRPLPPRRTPAHERRKSARRKHRRNAVTLKSILPLAAGSRHLRAGVRRPENPSCPVAAPARSRPGQKRVHRRTPSRKFFA